MLIGKVLAGKLNWSGWMTQISLFCLCSWFSDPMWSPIYGRLYNPIVLGPPMVFNDPFYCIKYCLACTICDKSFPITWLLLDYRPRLSDFLSTFLISDNFLSPCLGARVCKQEISDNYILWRLEARQQDIQREQKLCFIIVLCPVVCMPAASCNITIPFQS